MNTRWVVVWHTLDDHRYNLHVCGRNLETHADTERPFKLHTDRPEVDSNPGLSCCVARLLRFGPLTARHKLAATYPKASLRPTWLLPLPKLSHECQQWTRSGPDVYAIGWMHCINSAYPAYWSLQYAIQTHQGGSYGVRKGTKHYVINVRKVMNLRAEYLLKKEWILCSDWRYKRDLSPSAKCSWRTCPARTLEISTSDNEHMFSLFDLLLQYKNGNYTLNWEQYSNTLSDQKNRTTCAMYSNPITQ